MSFDWSEFLDLAHELVGMSSAPASQEAKERCALSRAYYAVFCPAKNFLLDEGCPLYGDGRDHREVQEQFKNSPDTNRRTLGQYLNRLKSDRIRADYRDTFPKVTRQVKIDLPLAQQALRILAGL